MSAETLKLESNGLRGAIPIELAEEAPSFSEDVTKLLKFHGIYQQHDRDVRGRNNRKYQFMVRSKIPGGRLTAQQYLVHDALADEFSQGDIRLTTRQGIQFHGVVKGDVKPTLRALNNVLVSTLGACGDVERNIMFCPAPFGDPIRTQIQSITETLAEHLSPRTPWYHQIWLEDEETGKNKLQKFDDVEIDEPIYGKTYMPRKFKTAIAFPGDNCTDILSNDLGLVALFDEGADQIHGFNIFVGGGMGQSHTDEDTFPRLAEIMGYAPVEKIVDVVEKIVLVQRDFGDRENRAHARLKYLIHDRGIDWFRGKVEEYLGYAIEESRPMPEFGVDDHLGWHQQVDGRWFIGLFVENGRVSDVGGKRVRAGLRKIVQRFSSGVVITPQQNIILSGFRGDEKAVVDQILADFGIPTVDQLSLVRRNSMACPAMPSCGLALAEAERYLPSLIDQVEEIVEELGLGKEEFTVRMTGCPNGCARPYMSDIGLVGRTLGKYNLYFGGNPEGTRMNQLYRELIPAADLPGTIRNVLRTYIANRTPEEGVGDWAARVGVDQIDALAEGFVI